MIASLVITLDSKSPALPSALDRISQCDGVEAGELADGIRLPITIETCGKTTMEETTRWLQGLEAVLNVDVVLVHFEDEPSDNAHHSRPS